MKNLIATLVALSLLCSHAFAAGSRPAPIRMEPRTVDHACPAPSQFVAGEIPADASAVGLLASQLRKGEYKTDPRSGGRILPAQAPQYPYASAAALAEPVAYDAVVVGVPAADVSPAAEAVRAAGLANVAARVKRLRTHHDMLHEQAVRPCLNWSGWAALQAEYGVADKAAQAATEAFRQALTLWENKSGGSSLTR